MRELLQVLSEEQKNNVSGGIYHKLQVDFAYNSNHIEGSCLSYEQTRYIFETHSIGVGTSDNILVNDIIETVNHFRCFAHIIESVNSPLSEAYIKNLHSMLKSGIMPGQDAVIGEYKKYPNEVGGIQTTQPSQVKAKITKLLTNSNRAMSLYDIIEFHTEFEAIHPFYDGNGRIGRLLQFKQCLENNIVPFYIDDFSKRFYYMGLKEWQVDGKKKRLINVCLDAQDTMKRVLDYFEIDYNHKEEKCRDIIQEHQKSQSTITYHNKTRTR